MTERQLLEELSNEELQYLKDEAICKLQLNSYDARTKEYKLVQMIEGIEYERWCASGEKDKPISIVVR